MNIQTSKSDRTYDAIVIGSGITGGWAAKEFADKGINTLVLERGRDVEHQKDYPTASKPPWELEYRGAVSAKRKAEYSYVGKFARAENVHFRLKDGEQPIVTEKPFRWVRGYHVGGKSLLWARKTQRWSEFDFEGPARDGYAVDWPIRYKDLEPWYDHVEKFIGVVGNRDNLDILPDSIVQPAFELSHIEKHFQSEIMRQYKDRHVISSRMAHLTDPQQIHKDQGRYRCMHQKMCNRGCVFGGYFSSNASTLPWAAKTGNMTLRPHSVVHSIIYDEQKGKATGVRVIDANTHEMIEYYARVIFLNASTFNSNAILLNSTSARFPNGLGNDSGVLGKYVAWHNTRARVTGWHKGFKDKKTLGKTPGGTYIPRFRNVHKQDTDFLRGYSVTIHSSRDLEADKNVIGSELTENILNPHLGDWEIRMLMTGETIPIEENHVRLHEEKTDKYGIPQIVFSCDWQENDMKQLADFHQQCGEMLDKAGFADFKATDSGRPPGSDVHEMGGVRMGRSEKTSILNEWNQVHQCKNVFVTDGSCMTSTGTQNPSLTFMALTARAANYAVEEMKRQNL